MGLTYKKNEKTNKYYVLYKNERLISGICNYLGITLDEFHSLFKECGGHYSELHGYYFSKEDSIQSFIVMLELSSKK